MLSLTSTFDSYHFKKDNLTSKALPYFSYIERLSISSRSSMCKFNLGTADVHITSK